MRGARIAAALVLAAGTAFCQGMAGGKARPAPRGKFSGRPFPAVFTDVAREVGLTAPTVFGRPDAKKYILEAGGAGAAFLDYDGDGLLDVFLVNGSRFETSPGPAAAPVSHLYRNTGKAFTDVSRAAGIARSGWGNGVCGGDFDNDGREDLYVTYWGTNSLYRNRGGAFEDIAAKAGVAGPADEWSTGCTFLDYDRDGFLDLFAISYVGFAPGRTPLPGQFEYCTFKGVPVFCGPRGLPFGRATLYRNRGNGTFEDVSESAGIRAPANFYGFSAAAADLDGDGWVDIYAACDSTPSLYFRNNRNGTFTELGAEAGIAYSADGAEQAGMGLAIADYDNDGWLDITKTNFIRDYPNLYRNLGKGFFEDVAYRAGLAVNPDYVLWGAGIEDFDNDGWKDLFQAAGHVYPELEKAGQAEPYRNPRLVYRNLGDGRFEDVSAISGPGVADRHSSRGAAFGDFDNDGDIDVLIVNMDEPPSLLRNGLESGNGWFEVKLQGVKSNRSAIGSTVLIRYGGKLQAAPVLSQSSYLSLNDARLHFGLGAAAAVDGITVHWASGAVEKFPGAAARSRVLLVEGSGCTAPLPKP